MFQSEHIEWVEWFAAGVCLHATGHVHTQCSCASNAIHHFLPIQGASEFAHQRLIHAGRSGGVNRHEKFDLLRVALDDDRFCFRARGKATKPGSECACRNRTRFEFADGRDGLALFACSRRELALDGWLGEFDRCQFGSYVGQTFEVLMPVPASGLVRLGAQPIHADQQRIASTASWSRDLHIRDELPSAEVRRVTGRERDNGFALVGRNGNRRGRLDSRRQ